MKKGDSSRTFPIEKASVTQTQSPAVPLFATAGDRVFVLRTDFWLITLYPDRSKDGSATRLQADGHGVLRAVVACTGDDVVFVVADLEQDAVGAFLGGLGFHQIKALVGITTVIPFD